MLVSKNIQIEFADSSMKAIDAIYDIDVYKRQQSQRPLHYYRDQGKILKVCPKG